MSNIEKQLEEQPELTPEQQKNIDFLFMIANAGASDDPADTVSVILFDESLRCRDALLWEEVHQAARELVATTDAKELSDAFEVFEANLKEIRDIQREEAQEEEG